MTVVSPTDRPKSIRNSLENERFLNVCCVILPIHCVSCRGVCHSTASDLFPFLFRFSGSSNLLEALTKGAMDAARVTMSVVVALLLYLALAEFISATLVWFGDRVDVPNFTFEVSTTTSTLHFSQ